MEQVAREGLSCTFVHVLAEAVFAGNAMISYGGATPYNARFGRQPQMLPDLLAPPADDVGGVGRNSQRLRELALSKIVEATAVARINRASGTHTTAAGQALHYQRGDLVVTAWHSGDTDRSVGSVQWHCAL